MSPFWRGFWNGAAGLPVDTPVSSRQPARMVMIVGGAYIAASAFVRLVERFL